MAKRFEDFTRLYPLSKTLRFEAKPIGATLQNFIDKKLLQEDKDRAESYAKVKKLLDEYHKAFIDRVLTQCGLKHGSTGENDSLEEYYNLYTSSRKEDSEKDAFRDVKNKLRSAIVDKFTSDAAFKHLTKEARKLLESYKVKDKSDEDEDENKEKTPKAKSSKGEPCDADLVQFIQKATDKQLHSLSKDDAMSLVNEFKGYTTYFTDYHKVRENLYSADEKSSSIAYRLINENLPKFIDNVESFKKISATAEIKENLQQFETEFSAILNGNSIQEVFQLGFYDHVLTQKGIETYNAIIGGMTDEQGTKFQGINEYINLYNQQHKDAKLPLLKVLSKQLLSDRDAISWLPDEFHQDQEVLDAIKKCYKRLDETVLGHVENILCHLSDYDTNGVFLCNDSQLGQISQKMFGDWSTIQNAILQERGYDISGKDEKRNMKLEDAIKKEGSFSLQYLNTCLLKYVEGNGFTVSDYFAQLGAINTPTLQRENLFALIRNAYTDLSDLLGSPYPEDKNLAQEAGSVALVKRFMDALMALLHYVKPLLGTGDESGKDESFYGEFSALWTELETVIPLYNMVRNYMSRKPYSESKIKLNFKNPKLLDGWDANKESDNASIILRRDGKYYLAIMDKDSKKLLKNAMPSEGACYEKMVYKLIPGANKMLPKVCFSKSRKDEFKPSTTIKNIRDNGTFKQGKNFNLKDLHTLIDFYKQCILKYKDWSKFNFHFSDTSTYKNINDFYQEVDQQSYMLSFTKLSVSYVDQLVKEGKMYLFQIYNKDFSESSKGTPNMHTLYWKALFDERNLKDFVYKLNGQAELFYREKSISSQRPTHPAKLPIANKNKENKKKESCFDYDLIKNKRYTVDKFLFHVPITMNFKSTGNDDINVLVRDYLHSAKDTHIIGIDRGERHLLYLVVTDLQGRIMEQYSLNEIVNEYQGNTYRTNYHNLLDEREADREKARQSWQTIESIKELKEGYLSQVIHKIAQLMVKYHAVVVLEDLNRGFMRGRQKVEKQVYQKFEKALIDKLNYLVDKQADANENGGWLKAYQLTKKFESFQKMSKQCGFLLYVPAWNTSKIDPVTGFVNLLDTRYQNIEKSKAFFSKFDSIRYNADKDWFEFGLDYDKFGTKAEGTKTQWTLCTKGKRIKTSRNAKNNSQWESVEIDLTEEFKNHFASYHIDINGNLKEAIANQSDRAFFEYLMKLMKLTLQMRNSMTGTEIDYLVSPVSDENGLFYDSRTCGDQLPKNADANGAFNIARKGLMWISQLQACDKLDHFTPDLSNKSWLHFAQQKPYKHD